MPGRNTKNSRTGGKEKSARDKAIRRNKETSSKKSKRQTTKTHGNRKRG